MAVSTMASPLCSESEPQVNTVATGPLRQVVNRLVRRCMPGLYENLRFRFGHPATMVEIGRVVEINCGGKVVSGPFAGMVYTNAVTGSFVPKLLGCYEEELHGVLEYAAARNYEQVIDIGCGEGYYAVGLAMRMPLASVVAFDIDADARQACVNQARRNGVENRVQVRSACTPDHLRQILSPRGLVISDCEGYEAELLRPDLVTALQTCDILVELHEQFVPGITQTIMSRFSNTHEVELIDVKPRDPATYPALQGFTHEKQRLAVDEARYGAMQWAWMRKS
ncbi:MAG: methyltransferase [Planctomycetota bacterium]|nr:methyltransferase [Planctomycetota bacterium]